jgi:hypothetical protein
MQVLCTKYKLSFPVTRFIAPTKEIGKPGQPGYQAAAPGYHQYGANEDAVTITPKPEIQTVPDWVRETNTFKAAAAAGKIVELNVVHPQIAAQAQASA